MYLDKNDTSISSQLYSEDPHPPSTPRQGSSSTEMRGHPRVTRGAVTHLQPQKSYTERRAAGQRRDAMDYSSAADSGNPACRHGLAQICLLADDAVGAQRAVHNCDAERVRQDGFWDASHTVVALEETFVMVVAIPKHIHMIAAAKLQSTDEKVRFLRSISLYAHCTTACLRRMADVMVRKWYPSDTAIVAEGGQSQEVFFTVKGQLRVVKNAGTPSQTTVNVMGSGSCFGDLGVLNGLPRSHSIITVRESQFLGMRITLCQPSPACLSACWTTLLDDSPLAER